MCSGSSRSTAMARVCGKEIRMPTVTPTSPGGSNDYRAPKRVLEGIAHEVPLSSKQSVYVRNWRFRHALRALCMSLRNLPARIRWAYKRQQIAWPVCMCHDCSHYHLSRQTNGQRLRVSGNGMLQSSKDREFVMSLHSCAGSSEAHLFQLGWFFGAEWALNSPDKQGCTSDTYAVF